MAFLGYLTLILVIIHFAIPLLYFVCLRRRVEDLWKLEIRNDYEPKIAVIVPTYNEAPRIKERLENIKNQNYPRKKLRVIVVDSASIDKTAEIARNWASKNRSLKVKVIEEGERRGKILALNYAFKHVPENTDVVIFTDADCKWKMDALKNAAKYFSDTSVGAVTCCIYPYEDLGKGLEDTYRYYNNMVRVAESKIWSTPIAHGPFLAFRRILLWKMGRLPTWSKADDSTPASLVVFMGYRAIAAPDVIAYEYVPVSLKGNLVRRIRRAQHLIQHFLRTRKKVREMGLEPRKPFKYIFQMEKFLHIVNPWILLSAAAPLLILVFVYELYFGLLLAGMVGLGVSVSKTLRMWLLTQVVLAYAFLKNLFGETEMWEPIRESRG